MCSLGDAVINIRKLLITSPADSWTELKKELKKMVDFGGKSRDLQQERLIALGGNRYFYVA